MKIIEIIVSILGILFCMYAYLKSYSKMFNKKLFFSFKKIIGLLVITLFVYYNTFYNYEFSKMIISIITLFIMFKIIYNENFKETLINFSLLYLTGWIIETILGIFLIYFVYSNFQQIDDNIMLKVLFSTLMMLFLILFSNVPAIKKIILTIKKYMSKVLNIMFIIIFFIVAITLLTYYLIISTNVFSLITIIFLLCFLAFLIIVSIFQIIKAKKSEEKQEALLGFMKEYEIIIDEERIDRHEMVNNLLALKSFKNKNSKDYEQLLNQMILTYQNKTGIKGLYNMPSGLKGLLYYKIHEMKNNDIEVFVNISNNTIVDLENINASDLYKICKILGILLDNAKEASEKANEKFVLIDVYKKDKSIITYIENSMCENDNVNIEKIKKKGFSTKGKNRGYGLFIVNNFITNSNKINLEQKIENNKFISILEIKIKKEG